METLLNELRYSVRTLTKSRGFSSIAILTLALGIGASTAIFSVVNAVLLRALPYPHPDEIVRVWEQSANGRRMNLADLNFQDFLSQNNSFASLAEYSYFESPVSGGSEPVQSTIAVISSGFLETMGMQPFLGRAFTAEEYRAQSSVPGALVSYRYWRRYLGSASDLSQFHLRMEQSVYAVAGVLPEAFDFPAAADVWVPRRPGTDVSRTGHNWRAIGRLRSGVTVAQARANLTGIAQRLKKQYGKDVDLTAASVSTLADDLVGDVRKALLTLLAAVGLLLLVACANVAGLLVARTSARRQELAVRAALGAGRGRLMQQFLAESFTLAAAGGALGLLIAASAVRVLPAIVPAALPRREGIAIDPAVLLFASAVTFAVALSLGLFAAWRAARADLQDALTSSARGSSGSAAGHRLRGFVVSAEIAATLVILTGAGLLGRSFLRLVATSPGFRPDNLITMEFPVPVHQFLAPDSPALLLHAQRMEDLVRRLRTIPGAGSVGLTSAMPVAAGDDLPEGDFVLLNGQRAPSSIQEFSRMVHNPSQKGHALYCIAGEEYFATMGIPIVRGRVFNGHDDWNSPHVAVISEALAQQRWPGQDPIGQTIEFGNMDGNLKPLTIVGIAGDVRARGLDSPPGAIIYVDYRQRGLNANAAPTILLRSAAPPREVISAARAIFHDFDPESPVKFSTFADEMGGWLADRRFLLLLVGVFAVTALTLAAVGIYGVVAFSVARRTREIGIRMALGAQKADVLRIVLGEGGRLAAAGVAVGIAVSFAVTRLMASLLFGVSATDPLIFAAVAAILCAVALLASYIPARRAARLDPNDALHYE